MNLKFKIPTRTFVCKAVSYHDIASVPPEMYLNTGELNELIGKDEKKRPGWLASRYALKMAVRDLVPDVEATDIEIEHLPSGVPVIKLLCEPNVHTRCVQGRGISLSHSGSRGAALVTTQPRCSAGIDIERVREWREETLEAFLTAEEYQEVMGLAQYERNVLATQYWTAKEAYLKALGVGLRWHPSGITVSRIHPQWSVVGNCILATVQIPNG